jgi:hypothetical protein
MDKIVTDARAALAPPEGKAKAKAMWAKLKVREQAKRSRRGIIIPQDDAPDGITQTMLMNWVV